MPAQCPGCNKFPSLETEEPEVQSVDIDNETGEVTAEIRVYRTSACCGEEMKETTFSAEITAPEELAEHIHDHQEAGEEYSLSVEEDTIESTEEMQTKDRKGKPIKSFRYMKTLIGYSATFTVSCDCGFDCTVESADAVAASEFEELV